MARTPTGRPPGRPRKAELADQAPSAVPVEAPAVEPVVAAAVPAVAAPVPPVSAQVVPAGSPAPAAAGNVFGPGISAASSLAPAGGRVHAPDTDPVEMRDLYQVPEGCVGPANDPHRPPVETSVLVEGHEQLVASGAWRNLHSGNGIEVTRDVMRVFWPAGVLAPSYALVAARGTVLPKVAAA